MDTVLFSKLICINCCKPSLQHKHDKLTCSSCGQNIPLYNGIPDFLSNFHIGKLILKEEEANPETYESMISKIKTHRFKRIDKPLLRYVQGDVLEI